MIKFESVLLAKIKNKYIGEVGTKERNRYEKKLKKVIKKHSNIFNSNKKIFNTEIEIINSHTY